MSDNIVEITDNSRYSIEISTSLETNNNVTIELANSSNVNVDIINNSTVLVGDLPQGYPLNWTVGNLPVTRVSGLVGQSGINYNSGIISLSGIPSQFLPVQNLIAGSGISVSNNDGIFNISVTGQFGLTGEQVDDRVNNLLVAGSYINLNYNDLADSLTVSVTGLQPSGNYSVVGHSHNSSDISDFNNSVDQRISLSNLQPSGNYSVVGHGHVISDISGLQLSLDSKQPTGNYSLVGHSHLSSDITDFISAASGSAPVQSVASRTGNIVLTKNDVGLNNVDNTSDLNKPVSIAQATADLTIQNNAASDATAKANNAQAYSVQRSNHTGTQLSNTISDFNTSVSGLINGIYAPLNSPSLTGIPTAPTASSGSNNNQIANTQFVRNEISSLVSSAPSTLDTLNELANALGNDPNFATTIANNIGGKVSKSGDSMTGALTAPSGNFTNKLTVNNTDVSLSGHSHSINDITNLQTSLDNKAPVLNPIFSGTVSGITKSMVGLGNVDNTSDINKPVSTAQAAADTAVQNAAAVDATTKANNAQAYSIQRNNHTGTQTSSTISDFNTSVSGLLPVKNITSGSGISVSNSSGSYTIAVTGNFGLTSEEVDDRVSGLLSAGTGIVLNYDDPNNTLTVSTSGLAFISGANFNSLSVTGVPVSISGHKHIYSDITNFSSGVQDSLTTTLLAGSFINLNYDSGLDTLTISTSGLQPSGNYSVVGHTHTSANITDFNSSVSGLLPVTNIISGTGISISSSGSIYTVNSTINAVAEANSLVTTVFNKTASTINKGSVVYINGGQGDRPTIQLAIASTEVGSSKTYGIVQNNIASMSEGKVVVAGALTGLNTDVYNPTAPVGDVNGMTLWLSPTASGQITTIKPAAPYHMVSVGTVVRTHQNEGVIEVRVQNGFELEELHNVAINGVSNGQFLQYNSTSGLWIPSSSGNFAALTVNNTGVSVSGHTHSSSDITDFNTGVSGLLPVTSIIGGTNIGVVPSGGSYTVSVTGQLPPQITIHDSSTDIYASNQSGLNYIYIFNIGSENSSLILPSATNNKSYYTVKNNSDGIIYLKTSESQNIDNYSPSPLPSGAVIGLNIRYSSIGVISNNTGWSIV